MTLTGFFQIIRQMKYPGGKGLSYQRFINLMPPHDVYIETHLGGGAVIRKKRPAKRNIAIELNPDVIDKWHETEIFNFELIHDDAFAYLSMFPFKGNELLYCDPPYLRETRRSKRKIYKHDYTVNQHIEFLELIKSLPCKVMISGYQSKLYADALSHWHLETFQTKFRKNKAVETIWMNYKSPIKLHDYRYLGDNFRERDNLKRKVKGWSERLQSMPILEQRIIMHAMQSVYED